MATNDQLVAARNAGVEYQKQADALKIQQLLAERSSPYIPFNRENNPSSYGNDTIEDEPGTDPAEMIQLELPLESVKKLKIMAQDNPEIAQSIMDGLKISSENEDDYGPGSKKYPQTPGKPWQVETAQSRKDKMIKGVVGRYGKKDGVYEDEDKLLRNLLTIAEST